MKPFSTVFSGLITALVLAGLAGAPDNAAAGNTRTVSSLNDDGGADTLRFLIGASFDGDTVDFSVTGTIVLTNGALAINHGINIIGPGSASLTVSGNNVHEVFNVAGGTTGSISGLMIANGYASGGIYNFGTLTINNCTLSGNQANGGGGIFNGGILTINNCTLSGNQANGGGGIANGGILTINNSTLSGNSASEGGGIYNGGNLTVNNCTLSGNSAHYSTSQSGEGGGMVNTTIGTLAINNCTISGNFAEGYPGWAGGGVMNYASASNFVVLNTIIANNTSLNGDGPDVNTSFGVISRGHNLIGNTAGSIGWVSSDLLNGNPLLGALQDNGGPTFTMAPSLNPISAVIDAGNDEVTVAPLNLVTDQRGLPRKSGAHVDIGAYEVNPPSNHIVTVTSDRGVGSLRQAIADAASLDTITFAPGGAGTITLTTGELAVGKSISLIGPTNVGVAISGNNASRVFLLTGGTVSLSSLTVAHGNTSGPGGGFFSETGSTLILNNCTVSSNVTANSGGGIANNGTVLATNCTFSGNQAAAGGGIYTYAGPVVLRNCTVCFNTSGSDGGGLFDYGIAGSLFTIGSSLVASNTAIATGPDVISSPTDPFISLGYNLIGKGSLGYGLTNGVNHDQVGGVSSLDVKIGPLQDNGGPTFTHALVTGSPAIDQGKSLGVITDQRGQPRPYDSPGLANAIGGDGSDIGAFEVTLPILSIARFANNVIVSWPASDPSYTLQFKTNLNPSVGWTTVSPGPGIVGALYTVTNSAGPGSKFYRLIQ